MSVLDGLIKKHKELFKSVAIRFLRERKKAILEELSNIEEKIKKFEKEYGNFKEFSSSLSDNFSAHEIWFEWRSLMELKKELEKELRDIENATKEIIGQK